MTTSFRALMAEAHRLGCNVQLAHLDDLDGSYDHETDTITVDIGLTFAEMKDALAHELGHAHYGHTCSTDTNEARADRRAATLLVDPQAYRAACRVHPGDPGAIADELGLTRRIVRVFEKELLPELALRRGA